MKKLTSIILALTMLLSCAALVGCAWEDIFAGIWGTAQTTTTTTVTTTNPDESPKELKITHGDNFTEEDIDFLYFINGYIVMLYDLMNLSFSDFVNQVKNQEKNMYLADVDLDNPIYLCGFFDMNNTDTLYEFGGYLDVEKYIWYKYTDAESIPNERDGLVIGWTLRLYNATLTMDIGKDISYEMSSRFYDVLTGKGRPARHLLEHMIFFNSKSVQDLQYIRTPLLSSYRFEGYTTTDGRSYFVLRRNKSVDKEGNVNDYLAENREHLGDYYDVLCPYFERIEEMDYEFTNSLGEEYTIMMYGIPLDVMSEVLFQGGKDE